MHPDTVRSFLNSMKVEPTIEDKICEGLAEIKSLKNEIKTLSSLQITKETTELGIKELQDLIDRRKARLVELVGEL